MTTKRKFIGRLVPCRCFRGEEEVISVLDYSHCSLQQVPKEIFSFERTLEELYLDANQIEELPKQLFNCQALKKLSMPDNDLSNLPTTIASLVNLKELDISKNGIQEFPDNIKCCKCLSVVEASVNPIAKLPDGFTQLLNLTQLFLNDAFLEYLPPEVLEQIHSLKELWLDNNSLQTIPGSIGKLRQLRYLDLAKNRIESLDADISGCESLEDLLLSSNMLQQLPDTIGKLKKLTTLKVDDNQLTSLPNTIGSLSLLEEFDCSCNELESLPPTIGYLHSLRTFAADENFLTELPREIGNCRNVTVMSLRSNKIEFLPDEIGQMTKLRVLNLSDNRLKNLPFTFTKLKDLAALWLSDNQSKALIPLQTEAHPETKQRVLTNYMFPQQPRHDEDYQSDSDSFNPTLWEEQRQQRMTVAFEFEDKKEEEDNSGKVKVPLRIENVNLFGPVFTCPFEDRTAFPSKLEITPGNSPNPDRKDFEQEMMELPGTFPSTRAWGFLDSTDSGMGRGHPNISAHVQGVKESNKLGTMVLSKSSERLSPMMKEVKAKFKKSQSIDEIDMGSYRVYSIPLDSYSSSIENQGSVDRADLSMPLEQSMSRSQSAPMLDDDLDGFGLKSSQQQKPAIPKKVYHFDQSFNPQRAMDLMKAERRVPPPFPNAPEYVNQPGKTLSKELVSPRGYRGYPPMEQMFSFAQTAVTDDAINPQLSVQPQRSRPGFLRRADSLVSSTEMALFRRVAENHELQLAEHYNRPQQSMLEQQNSLSTITDTQFHKRNGRYDEDYSSYQEPKKPIMGYPTKSLTQRRPLSARSYSTETYGASQARPVSARPTMAALLEKLPSDYNLSTCTEKSPEDPSSKMPVDWRQQLLRHIEAKRLDRVSKQASLFVLLSCHLYEVYIIKGLPNVCPQPGVHNPHQQQTMMITSANHPHRTARDQQYEGAINKVSIQQYQSPLPMPITTTSPRPQSARCFIQTKGQKSMDGFPEQLCVRIEKNPGLGFSISGGISGQGNPFKPSDMGIFVTRVQPDGPASNVLRPGDKILKANGHSFLHMEHETAVSLLKNFPKTVDLVILRESTT
uniref:Leucine-rich repeat-containing protein 7 n=1 Tax=Cyprinus carpio TaxID=7962 RepID=A0A8C1Z7Z3_CYPCA